jgi:hypothetical protein
LLITKINLNFILIYRHFTELHLAQIKTIVPEFFEFSLMKSSDKPSFELEISPVYGKYLIFNLSCDNITFKLIRIGK